MPDTTDTTDTTNMPMPTQKDKDAALCAELGRLMQTGQVTATTDFNEVAAEGAVYDRIA